MRISICGVNTQDAINKIESVLKVEVKNVWDENNSNIIDYAAETYKYFNEKIVVFNGSTFDFLGNKEKLCEGYDDVYEQIALNSLANLDYIIVVTEGLDKSLLKSYREYQKMFPEKFYLFNTAEDIEIIMK